MEESTREKTADLTCNSCGKCVLRSVHEIA